MNPHYAYDQVKGVCAMALNLGDWERSFDRSLDGVFRSFFALLWAAPFLILNFVALQQLFANAPGADDDPLLAAPQGFWIAANVATFVLDWATGLAALLAAAHYLGASKRAGDAVIGYNWLQLVTAAAQAAPTGLGVMTKSAATFSVAMLPIICVLILMIWGILRRGLGLAPGVAVALAAVSLLLSALVGALCHAAAVALYAGA